MATMPGVNCPRCHVPLQKSREEAGEESIEALRCPECTGHWVQIDALHALEQVVDVRLIEWHRLPGEETQGKILFCPRCPGQKAMDKVVSRRDQRVVMDHCLACDGVWLDYGELEAIQQKNLFAALADVFSFIRGT